MNGDIPAVPVTTLAGLASLTQRKYSSSLSLSLSLPLSLCLSKFQLNNNIYLTISYRLYWPLDYLDFEKVPIILILL